MSTTTEHPEVPQFDTADRCQRTGKDVRATQELMRHKSLSSTQIYTKVSSLAKVEIVRRLEA